MLDISNRLEYGEAFIEILSITKQFKRPMLILLNKTDCLGDDFNEKMSVYEDLRIEDLKKIEGVYILPFCAFSSHSIGILKDWLERIFIIYGKRRKKVKKGNRKGRFWMCFCGGEKKKVVGKNSNDED